MGIGIFTKYEDAANNNIKFDVSKFDFSFDDDTSPADTATDFDNIILEKGGVFHIIRQSTDTDTMGTISDVRETVFRVYGYIMDISKKDYMVHDMGLAVPGNRTLYVKPEYSITSAGSSETNSVKEGDILKDRNNYRWKVIKIVSEPIIGNTKIYKKCVVQSLGLEGSP